ncbi:MAG: TRAP transporter large permease [Paracoccus denitrificans]|uniref:TRAP transporter large permease protein n=1 Tax=Paracoccus denitrificans TaxID=266 RepID=A0A533I5Z8_PARDE|nr:MAG: TRAP transporter large permease [Paracoccus denitrificans]
MIIFAILATLLILLFTGLPIFAGLTLYGGALLLLTQGNFGPITDIVFHEVNRYLLVAIPLFGFMANIMIKGRVVDDLYDAAYTFTRHLPGGLAVATILACTLFAAISGSSVATAMTIGAVAIPQMLRFGYDERLAYGVVAAGGTLGILIPPSGPMILYGVATDTSIGGLFMAGLVPGIALAGIFILWAVIRTAMSGTMTREKMARPAEMLRALRQSFWAILMPVCVLGGMYAGIFTATEAAAAGAWLSLIITIFVYRSIGWRDIWDSAGAAARMSAMLFMILAGATVFSHVLTKMRVPQQVVEALVGADFGMIGFVVIMMVMIMILGMFLESVAIILITAPVILPAMVHLNIDPIWYGVLLVVNLEMAMITPPVGMNLFTIKAITSAPMGRIVAGSAPYVLLMILFLALLIIFPEIVMWLPNRLM